jgi:hypothetical protein
VKRLVLYEQQQDRQFHCVLEVWDGERFKEVLHHENERAIHAILDTKRMAMLKGWWTEHTPHEGHDYPRR